MLKRRRLYQHEEEDVVAVKLQRLNEPNLELSKSENEKLSYDYWYELLVGDNKRVSEIEYGKEVLLSCLDAIQKAYVAVKKSGKNGVFVVIEDENARMHVFHFAKATCFMNQYFTFLKSKKLELGEFKSVESDVSSKVFEDFEKLDESGKIRGLNGKAWPNDDTLESSKLLSILLTAKEILTQLGVHPKLSEHNSSEQALLENPAFLVQLLEVGVKMLWVDIRCAESQMIETLTASFASYSPGSSEYNLCCDMVDEILEFSQRLHGRVETSTFYLSSSVFRKVYDLLSPDNNPLTGERDFFYAKFFRRLENMQKMQKRN